MKYSRDFLTKLYRTMLRIRLCEESLIEPILNGEIRCPVHLCTGQEAVAVGVCAALEKKDYIFGTHRSHGHYIAKGGKIKELIAEIYGKDTGCSKGRGGSMHLNDVSIGMLGSVPIVAGTISLALGSALASKIRKENSVSLSFFGDGATGEGVLYESLNFAALKKLPLIFVCENNLYSTHLSIRECRPENDIFKIGAPFCIPSLKIDGNDVLKVYAAAQKAVSIARSGKGPVFIECLTYRLRGHVGPDDNIQGEHVDIRPKSEIEKWKKKDPLLSFESYLFKKRVLNKERIEKIKEDVLREVKDAFSFAQKSNFPKRGGLNKYVFKE